MKHIHIQPMSAEEIAPAEPEPAQTEAAEGCTIQTLLRLAETIEDADLVAEHPQLAQLMADRRNRRAA